MTYVVHTSLRASHRPQLSSSVRAISLPFVFNVRYNPKISKPYFYYVAVKTNPNSDSYYKRHSGIIIMYQWVR